MERGENSHHEVVNPSLPQGAMHKVEQRSFEEDDKVPMVVTFCKVMSFKGGPKFWIRGLKG